MILEHINWFAVAVTTVGYFALGAIWFNPKVFGTAWGKAHKLDFNNVDKSGLGKIMAFTFILTFISVTAVAYFIYSLGAFSAWHGAKIGLILGCGFSSVGIAMNHLYLQKPFSVILIDTLYHVVGAIISGIILALWR